MASLSPAEKEFFEELFGMDSGYILENVDANITNAKFASIVKDTTGLDVYRRKYQKYGSSKAKRLRAFWELESDENVADLLNALLDIFVLKEQLKGERPYENEIYKRCRTIVQKLSGEKPQEETSDDFIDKDFGEVSLDKVDIEDSVKPILETRLTEATKSLSANAPLSVIFMCGSILEGLLLGIAQRNPKQFNTCKISPKDKNGKVKQFNFWSLSQFIDVACHLDYLNIDIQKFSHALRDFRNYIHPYQQMQSGFAPNRETAKICLQVLRAAIVSLENK